MKEAIKRASHKGITKDLLIDVHKSYLTKYGVNEAFRNFFFQRLDSQWRNILAETIEVVRNDPPDFQPKKTSSLEDLIRYLVDFRHSFAHGLESHYSLPTKEEARSLRIDNYSEATFFTYQRIYSSGAFETVLTKNLLDSLVQAIQSALWNYILERTN